MTYSDQYKFIFLAIPKTGSRTIQSHLQQFGIRSKKGWVPNHDNYEQVKGFLGAEKCNDYLTFAFFRNPWSLLISEFFYNKSKHQLPLHKKSVIQWLNVYRGPDPFMPYLYDKEGNLILDFIGKLEHINDDLKTVCERIGIPAPESIPQIGRREAKYRLHYTAYYDTPQLINKIGDMFAQSLSVLNYEFADAER